MTPWLRILTAKRPEASLADPDLGLCQRYRLTRRRVEGLLAQGAGGSFFADVRCSFTLFVSHLFFWTKAFRHSDLGIVYNITLFLDAFPSNF